jgi:hypothetical protein
MWLRDAGRPLTRRELGEGEVFTSALPCACSDRCGSEWVDFLSRPCYRECLGGVHVDFIRGSRGCELPRHLEAMRKAGDVEKIKIDGRVYWRWIGAPADDMAAFERALEDA